MRCSLRLGAQLPSLIKLKDATFYRVQPSSSNAVPLFPKTTLQIPAHFKGAAAWAIVGASTSVRTDFLNVLRGNLICDPPTARAFPLLSTDEIIAKDPKLQNPQHAIGYVGFDAERGNANLRGSYLSQRYESKREKEDYVVRDFLLGRTALNADDSLSREPDTNLFDSVASDLRLEKLLATPVSNLSNGQSRRARIAKALLLRPELLLLDSPFMGLDVRAVLQLAEVLQRYAEHASPRLIMALRSDEHMPEWMDNFIMLKDDSTIEYTGNRADFSNHLRKIMEEMRDLNNSDPDTISGSEQWGKRNLEDMKKIVVARSEVTQARARLAADSHFLSTTFSAQSKDNQVKVRHSERLRIYRLCDIREKRPLSVHKSGDGFDAIDPILDPGDAAKQSNAEPLIEMEGVQVSYGSKMVLGDWDQNHPSRRPGLWWTVKRGQRWGVFGPNGSGKTTLSALITSDHPQSYSLPIKFFGRARLPEPGKPGLSFFDLQKRIGFSSPELHAFFPKTISIRQALESAWAETPLSKTELTPDQNDQVEAFLLWFRAELCPELGMTELQRDEAHRLPLVETKAFGTRNRAWIRDRREQHIQERITTNQHLGWADEKTFGSLPSASQRVLLFLRALVKRPDIVILDEAFSGMDPFTVLKCQAFLSHGQKKSMRLNLRSSFGPRTPASISQSELDRFDLVSFGGLSEDQALIFIAHRQEEVPGSVRNWLCLPEPGEGLPRFGVWDGPLILDPNKWRQVWDLPILELVRMPIAQRMPRRKWGRGAEYVFSTEEPEAARQPTISLADLRARKKEVLRQLMMLSRYVRYSDVRFQQIKLAWSLRQPGLSNVANLISRAQLLHVECGIHADHVLKFIARYPALRKIRHRARRKGLYRIPRTPQIRDERFSTVGPLMKF